MPEMPISTPLGIFGGTFDPVHYGHLRLAESATERLGLAGVRWIPAGRPALRTTSPQVDAAQRLEMVRLAISDNPRFELDAAEIECTEPSYTVPTLERLRRQDVCGTQRPLVLLVGADAFIGLLSWHRWECLLDLAHIAIAHRPRYPVENEDLPHTLSRIFRERFRQDAAALSEAPSGCIVRFPMAQLDISATRIRQLLSKGRSVRYLVPDPVLEHIRKSHFYQES